MRLSKFAVLPAVLLASLCVTATAHAYLDQEDITKRWGLGLNAAAAFPAKGASDPQVLYDANITYGVMDYLALQLDIGYNEFSYGAFGVDFGDLHATSLILSLQPRYPFEIGTTQAALYGLVGAGVMFYDFKSADQIREVGRSVRVDNAFAFRLGLGMDWFLTHNFATNLELSWTMVNRNVVLAVPEIVDGPSENADASFWNVGAGIKYYFD